MLKTEGSFLNFSKDLKFVKRLAFKFSISSF